jgi:hypothetical protein
LAASPPRRPAPTNGYAQVYRGQRHSRTGQPITRCFPIQRLRACQDRQVQLTYRLGRRGAPGMVTARSAAGLIAAGVFRQQRTRLIQAEEEPGVA